jgi:hypothetical protein
MGLSGIFSKPIDGSSASTMDPYEQEKKTEKRRHTFMTPEGI